MNKQELSERDICTKFITPALRRAGWDELTQLREEVTFTKGRVIVRGRMVSRGKAKRADYILYFKPNIPLAVIEAKDNHCSVGDGLQQALEYAEITGIDFNGANSSNRVPKNAVGHFDRHESPPTTVRLYFLFHGLGFPSGMCLMRGLARCSTRREIEASRNDICAT
jgi:type I site-specific restriction endonuclease